MSRDLPIVESPKNSAPVDNQATHRSIDHTAELSAPVAAGARLLIYSHDTFGLGHLRRCLKIGQSLKHTLPDLNILLVTGSPLVHRYDLPEGIDYVKLPAVRKTGREAYEARTLRITSQRVLDLRRAILLSTVQAYDPDFVLVDHSPVGMKSEMEPSLRWLKSNRPDAVCVLGLRDIVDDPELVAENWRQNGIYEVLDEVYDHILVYGTPLVFDPRSAYLMTPRISDKVTFCNYIAEPPGTVPPDTVRARRNPTRPRITLTLGGGDGAFDTLAVPYVRMLEAWDGEPVFESVIVTGPFVTSDEWRLLEPARRMGRLRRLRFVKSTRPLLSTSDLVICTAGYNTATEVVTWARRCLMIPRVLHRREQLLRAQRFAALGLVTMLEPGQVTPAVLMQTIQEMLHEPREPLKEARKQGLIPADGGLRIAAWFKQQLEQRTHREQCA